VDATAEGIEVPTETVVNGAFEANICMPVTTGFCLDMYSGEGSAVETDPGYGRIQCGLGAGEWVCRGGKESNEYRQGNLEIIYAEKKKSRLWR
jgi:hypothetical protein